MKKFIAVVMLLFLICGSNVWAADGGASAPVAQSQANVGVEVYSGGVGSSYQSTVVAPNVDMNPSNSVSVSGGDQNTQINIDGGEQSLVFAPTFEAAKSRGNAFAPLLPQVPSMQYFGPFLRTSSQMQEEVQLMMDKLFTQRYSRWAVKWYQKRKIKDNYKGPNDIKLHFIPTAYYMRLMVMEKIEVKELRFQNGKFVQITKLKDPRKVVVDEVEITHTLNGKYRCLGMLILKNENGKAFVGDFQQTAIKYIIDCFKGVKEVILFHVPRFSAHELGSVGKGMTGGLGAGGSNFSLYNVVSGMVGASKLNQMVFQSSRLTQCYWVLIKDQGGVYIKIDTLSFKNTKRQKKITIPEKSGS